MQSEIRDLISQIFSGEMTDKPLEADHYFLCGQCAQAIDARSFAQIFHHLLPDHRRLTEADLTQLHPFSMRRNESLIVMNVLSGLSAFDLHAGGENHLMH